MGTCTSISVTVTPARATLHLIMPSSSASSDAPSTIPITVFTGFLGAGKTSIILSLLPQLPKGYRVVLLKNEFGDLEGQSAFAPFTCASHRLAQLTVSWRSRVV